MALRSSHVSGELLSGGTSRDATRISQWVSSGRWYVMLRKAINRCSAAAMGRERSPAVRSGRGAARRGYLTVKAICYPAHGSE